MIELIDIPADADHPELLALLIEHHTTDRPGFAVPIPVGAAAARVSGGAYILTGYSVTMGPAAGNFILTDGGVGGIMLAAESLAAGASITRHLGPDGIEVNAELWVPNGATLTNGSVFLRHRRRAVRTDR